jgi:pantoate--beta-alanine ligase
VTTVRLIGPGRAGRSLAAALADAGCDVRGVLTRADDLTGAGRGVDVLVIATPDAAISTVAQCVAPRPDTVVMHLSGALGLDVLAPHLRRASLHPLVPLPSPEVGRVRLRSGVTFAVAGDPVAARLAELLGGTAMVVGDEHRAAYHAAACIAANHLVALMGQVERVAASAGLGLDAFVGLAGAALTDVAELGPVAALTGPASRGDEATLERHRHVLGHAERPGYDAGVALARRLAEAASASNPTPSSKIRSRRAVASQRGATTAARGSRSLERGATMPARRVPADRSAAAALPLGRRASCAAVLCTTASGFSRTLDAERAVGRTVGLVPTMGALHDGHRSLIARARRECDVVAVTLFVNPLQFDDAGDLAAYPRTLERDVQVAGSAGASMVFAPSVDEMFPGYPAPVASTVHVAGVSEGLEGASRPGHFDGVATVVAKLFALSGPCRAYFGEKDFQQLAVVRQMVKDLSVPVEVVGCATVREPDGLAMSSRNARLSPSERRAARALHRALRVGRRRIEAGERDPGRVGAAMAAVLAAEPLVTPDYAVAVDPGTLRPPSEIGTETRLMLAARVGAVRLIDNEGVSRPAARKKGRAELLLVNTGEEI